MVMEVQALKDLFLAALAVPAEKRAAWLLQNCVGDEPLRQQLELMLAAHAAPQSLLDRPVLPALRPTTERNAGEAFLPLGAQVGQYKLLEQIGEGGFGIVYLAEQTQPVRRKVALKVVKPGMDTRQVVARFEAERQALAIMDHPNIAHVFDGGVTACGRPFFVMELVKGMPLTEFCDQNQLTPRQRLELFLPVCQAIQHAHQKGIIHRDLKPSNVLVTMHDTVPVVKVIDFGIAKALGQELTDKTLFTGFAQLVGTPLYMSPEQAGQSGLDIDTRSDIYALGVLLYELLTGTTPFDKQRFKRAGYDEICRIIREEEPPIPSTRLLASRQTLPSLSAQRQTEPARLTRLVRGELDWIIMKALEKDRRRRYATASELMNDLQRYLSDEPVLAHPPSALYRLRKLARRHVGAVVAGSLILLTLIGGIVGTTMGLWRAERALKAEAERAQGEQAAKEDLQRRLAQVDKGTEILAEIFADFNPIVAEKQGLSAQELLCKRLIDAASHLEGEAVGDPLVVARLQHQLGISLRELRHYDEAAELLNRARQTRERMLGDDDLDTIATKHHLAVAYRRSGKDDLAGPLLHEVVAVRTGKLGPEHLDTLSTRHEMASLELSRHNFARAEKVCAEVLALRTKKLGPDDLETVASKHVLARIYRTRGKPDLAEPLYLDVLKVRTAKLKPDHPDTLRTQHHLALVYHDQKKYAQAKELLERVVAIRTAAVGPGHIDTRSAIVDLNAIYIDDGDFSLAETIAKEQLAANIARVGDDHVETILSRDSLADIYSQTKAFGEAIPLLEKSLEQRRRQIPEGDPEILGRLVNLGSNYCEAGQTERGLQLIEKVRSMDVQDPHPAWVRDVLVKAYLQADKRPQAVALIYERLQEARQALPPDSIEIISSLIEIGRLLVEAKDFENGQSLLLEARHRLQRRDEVEKKNLVQPWKNVRMALVQLYDTWGKPNDADQWRSELESASTTPVQ